MTGAGAIALFIFGSALVVGLGIVALVERFTPRRPR